MEHDAEVHASLKKAKAQPKDVTSPNAILMNALRPTAEDAVVVEPPAALAKPGLGENHGDSHRHWVLPLTQKRLHPKQFRQQHPTATAMDAAAALARYKAQLIRQEYPKKKPVVRNKAKVLHPNLGWAHPSEALDDLAAASKLLHGVETHEDNEATLAKVKAGMRHKESADAWNAEKEKIQRNLARQKSATVAHKPHATAKAVDEHYRSGAGDADALARLKAKLLGAPRPKVVLAHSWANPSEAGNDLAAAGKVLQGVETQEDNEAALARVKAKLLQTEGAPSVDGPDRKSVV